jgi:hypothetical protein
MASIQISVHLQIDSYTHPPHACNRVGTPNLGGGGADHKTKNRIDMVFGDGRTRIWIYLVERKLDFLLSSFGRER